MSAMSVMTEASNEDAGDISPHDDDDDIGANRASGRFSFYSCACANRASGRFNLYF